MTDRKVDGSDELGLVYWQSRAAALEAEVGELRDRLLALAQVVPPGILPLLSATAAEMRDQVVAVDLFDGWEEGPTPQKSSLETELARAWSRLGRG